MDISFAHDTQQRLLKQRNLLFGACCLLFLILIGLIFSSLNRSREIVLTPVLRGPLSISSKGVSREYLELVTRDTAFLTLNRIPQNLNYWMEQVLNIVHPSAYGSMKADLLKIVNDQQGSDVAQWFALQSISVDPDRLTSMVTGEVHSMVGSKQVSATPAQFKFGWAYNGVELKLIYFGKVDPKAIGTPTNTAQGDRP